MNENNNNNNIHFFIIVHNTILIAIIIPITLLINIIENVKNRVFDLIYIIKAYAELKISL